MAHTAGVTAEPSPYLVPLADLEASARATDEDLVEEQDVMPAPHKYVNNEDDHMPGAPHRVADAAKS